jgi:hypothetical protein
MAPVIDEVPTPHRADLLEQGRQVLHQAAESGVTLRLLGSIAIFETCPKSRNLMDQLDRGATTDIDFASLSKTSRPCQQFFTNLGYSLHPDLLHSQEFGVNRLVFEAVPGKPKVDVFLDALTMSHTVNFKSRLAMDPYALTPSDLLLSKLQVHELTRNDLIDLCVLLAEPDNLAPTFDLKYLQSVLGADWGFWYSALLNLEALAAAVASFSSLDEKVLNRIQTNAQLLKGAIDEAPKSTKWKLRAKIGPKVKWYEDVEELQ